MPTTSTDGPQEPPCRCQGETALLRCQQLMVGYGGQALLPPIDFALCHNELCAVVGRNGAGKTTWFRTLLGLLPPVSGAVETCTTPLPMAYIPQRVRFDPIIPLRARDVVAMGTDRGRSFLAPFESASTPRRVEQALAEMGAAALAELPFRELSEGQKQRVLMARLLASEPALAVLDEPTAAMDEVAERQTMELIDGLRRDHDMSVLIVSHHLPVVSRHADQLVFLDRESQTVVAGTPDRVFAHPAFRARYGEAGARRSRAT